MNRKDAAVLGLTTALIAHLDAVEQRITTLLLDLRGDISQLREEVAGIKLELATHRHEEEQ